MSTERYADRMGRIRKQTAAGFHPNREDGEFLLAVIDTLRMPPLTPEQAQKELDALDSADFPPLGEDRINEIVAIVLERSKNPYRVSVDEVRRLRARLAEFDAMPFDEIVWTDDYDKPIELTQEQLTTKADWRFIGLSNSSFVEFVIDGTVETEQEPAD